MRRRGTESLHIGDEFFHAFIRIAQALDAMADARHWTYIFFHITQEVVHRHLVVHGMLEPAPRVRDRSAEARADHYQPCRHRLRHSDPGTRRNNRPQRSADAWPMIG